MTDICSTEMLSQYQWNIQGIAITCPRELIFRDYNCARLVQKDDIMMFYENGMMDIFSSGQLQTLFKRELSKDPNLMIYSKSIEVIVRRMETPFLVRRDSYYISGKPGNYFIQEVVYPYHQYSLSENEFHSYIKIKEHLQLDECEDDDIDDDVGPLDQFPAAAVGLTELASDPSVIANPFRNVPSAPELSVSGKSIQSYSTSPLSYVVDTFLPREIANLSRVVNYEDSEEKIRFRWNVTNYSYFAIKIVDEHVSIDYPDNPIMCRSQRYAGVRDDYIIFNSDGNLFAILTPDEFNLLFEVDESNHSKIILIDKIKINSILGVKLNALESAFWNGTFEYGMAGDYIMQIMLPNVDSRNCSVQPTMKLYQWIISADDAYNFFLFQTEEAPVEVSESLERGPEPEERDCEVGQLPCPYVSPFEVFKFELPCWTGVLRRFVHKRNTWKRVYTLVYCDRIVINPFAKSPGVFFFAECTSLSLDKIGGVSCLKATGMVNGRRRSRSRHSLRGTFTDFLNNARPLLNHSTSAIDRHSIYFTFGYHDESVSRSLLSLNNLILSPQLTVDSLRDLFHECRSWEKRKQLSQSIISREKIGVDVFTLLLSSNDFDWKKILSTPMEKEFGNETLVHLAIKHECRSILKTIYAQPFLEKISNLEYHTLLGRRSYACYVSNVKTFELIQMPVQFYDSVDNEGNTLLMLLCEKGQYSVVSSLLQGSRQFSLEYLNMQNIYQKSLLTIALDLVLTQVENYIEIRNFLALLVRKGCDPMCMDALANTPLHKLCFMFNTLPSGDECTPMKFLTALLIEDFAKFQPGSVCIKNAENQTPISLYVQMKEDLAELFFNGESVNLLKVADTLIDSSSELINNSSLEGSPLHICAAHGLASMFSHLIQKGATLNRKNNRNETPLDIISRRIQELRTRLFLTKSDRNLLNGLHKCYEIVMHQRESQRTECNNFDNSKMFGGISVSHTANGPDIKSGEVEALIHYLCMCDQFKEIDSKALVNGYHELLDHEEFVKLIFSELDLFIENNHDQLTPLGIIGLLHVWVVRKRTLAEQILMTMNILVLEFVRKLLDCSPQLFSTNLRSLLSSNDISQISKGILRFDEVVKFHRPLSLNPRINELVNENYYKITSLLASAKTPTTSPNLFVSFNPEEIVRQCSVSMQYLFKNIPIEEFLSPQYSDSTKCPEIAKFRKFKDRMQSYFVNEILRYSSIQDRANTISHLLKCVIYADTLYSNYELIEIFYLSLTTPPVYRLTDTFKLVQQNSSQEYEYFCKLTNGCCKSLHDKMAMCSPPAIPYIAYYAKVMHRCTLPPKILEITDGNRTVKHLNLQYLKIQSKHLIEIEKYQSIPYLFQFHDDIQREIVNCRMYPNDARTLDERSLKLQPKVM